MRKENRGMNKKEQAILSIAREIVFSEAGERIPSIIEYSQKYNISVGLIQKALMSLQEEGALEIERRKFDIIFMDPPYNQGLEQSILSALTASKILDDDVIIIVEADKNTDFSYVDELGLKIVKDKIYKNNRHLFLRKK